MSNALLGPMSRWRKRRGTGKRLCNLSWPDTFRPLPDPLREPYSSTCVLRHISATDVLVELSKPPLPSMAAGVLLPAGAEFKGPDSVGEGPPPVRSGDETVCPASIALVIRLRNFGFCYLSARGGFVHGRLMIEGRCYRKAQARLSKTDHTQPSVSRQPSAAVVAAAVFV
jgi:hypothetical protein